MTEIREPTQARQGSKEGVVRIVLVVSMLGAVIALAVVLFSFLR